MARSRRVVIVAGVLAVAVGVPLVAGAQQLPPGLRARSPGPPGVPTPRGTPGPDARRAQPPPRQGQAPAAVPVSSESLPERTRGQAITIAGKRVQLPPDAYVENTVLHALCFEGQPCPETPYLIVRRRQSSISVSVRTGKLFSEKTAPREGDAFRFLKEALR